MIDQGFVVVEDGGMKDLGLPKLYPDEEGNLKKRERKGKYKKNRTYLSFFNSQVAVHMWLATSVNVYFSLFSLMPHMKYALQFNGRSIKLTEWFNYIF